MANEDTTIQYGKWVIAGFIALLAVGVYFGFFNKASGTKTKVDMSFNQQQATLVNSQYAQFDGQTVTGSDVIAAINSFSNSSFVVWVLTNANPTTGVYYGATSGTISSTLAGGTKTTYTFSGPSPGGKYYLANSGSINDINYIEPTQSFLATMGKNDNGTANMIKFVQQ